MYEKELATASTPSRRRTDMEAAFLALSNEFDEIIQKKADRASPEMYRNVRRFILRLVSEIGDLTRTDMLEMQKAALKTAYEGIRKAIA